MPLDWETYTNGLISTYTNINATSSDRTYTLDVVNPEPALPAYLTYATGGYVWPSNFPDVATEAVSIHEVEELRARVDELEKQIAELKKRIGGGF